MAHCLVSAITLDRPGRLLHLPNQKKLHQIAGYETSKKMVPHFIVMFCVLGAEHRCRAEDGAKLR